MQEFKIGQTYEFETIDIRQNSVGNNYIALRYGDRDTFRVKPLPFQEEGNLPHHVYCKVVKIDPFTGLPILTQDLYKFYSENYKAGEEYAFKIIAVEKDPNTQANYYLLRDKFGISTHRLYFGDEQKYDIEEVHCFKIKKIDERGFLSIIDVSQNQAAENEKKKSQEQPIVDKEAEKTVRTIPTTGEEGPLGHEDQNTEFKSSLVFTPGNANRSISEQIDEQILTIVKTIIAFMNSDGGKLYIGVNNNGFVCGINDDFQHLNEGSIDNDEYLGSYKSDTDSYELKIRNAVRFYTHGNLAASLLKFSFEKDGQGSIYCCIEVKPSKRPVFVKDTLLYVRTGNQKVLIKGDEITYFISERMKLSIKDVFDDVDFSGAFSKEDFENIIKQVLKEQKSIPASPKPENKVIPVPVPTVKIPVANDEVWNHFTWYKDGGWSFQKEASKSPDVMKEVCVHKSEKDGRIVMCYDNGHINVVIPSKVRAGKTRGKKYANGWNTKAQLMSVFIMHPMHMLGAFSQDYHGGSFVKVHYISDFDPIDAINAQGPIFINPKLGIVTQYKAIFVDHRHAIPNLIFPKNQTSSTIGLPVSSPLLANEIDYLKDL